MEMRICSVIEQTEVVVDPGQRRNLIGSSVGGELMASFKPIARPVATI